VKIRKKKRREKKEKNKKKKEKVKKCSVNARFFLSPPAPLKL
jgi:hypothetical protein